MSEVSRYEQILKQQLNDLPLPDENLAWENMARLLAEDDDYIIPPPPVNKGCFMGALLFGLLATVACWVFIPFSKPGVNDKSIKEKINDTGYSKTVSITASKKTADSIDSKNNNALNINKERYFIDALNDNMDTARQAIEPGNTKSIKAKQKLSVKQHAGKTATIDNKNDVTKEAATNNSNTSFKKKKPKLLQKKYNARMRSVVSHSAQDEDATSGEVNSEPLPKPTADTDSLGNNFQQKVINSVNNKLTEQKKAVVNKTADTMQHTYDKKKTPVKTNLSFAAGIAVQQAIPLNGESTVPYNYYGRKGTVTDYIPSVYFRVYTRQKWFVQQEFRYGAPQYIKEYIYKTKVLDTNLVNHTTAAYFLKKTYYHQLPLSINYFVKPNWSVGTGIVYNKFVSAVSREDIHKTNGNSSPDSLISSLIVSDKDHSIFVKNNFQWLIETQYRRKKFSIGFRYVKDIKPYIEFANSSSGNIEKKRNYSANIFIRYEIWKSKRR